MSDLRRILVRLPNWLGDALLARPMLWALRRSLPDAELRAVGPRALLDLLAHERCFDGAQAWPASGEQREALARELRAWGPELAFALPPSFSSAWFLWRSGARRRIGYRADGRRLLLTEAPKRPPRGDRHLSDEYLALIEPILGPERRLAGAPARSKAAPMVPDLPATETATVAAAALLAAERVGGSHVVLGPGAIFGPAKRWPAERFVELGRGLAREHAVLVCGVAAERSICDAVALAIGPAARSLAGRTDLTVQAALCASADLAVCNDSGLAHLSAALGTPTVVIFGSTSSAWTAPLGRRVRVVQDAPVCSPCFQRTCRIGTVCLAAVTVERVARACEEAA